MVNHTQNVPDTQNLYMFRTVPLSIIRSFSLYTQQWYMVCCEQAVSKPVWHIPLLCVQWKTPDDGQRNCPKHVEFYSKNKSEKLVHLVGFIMGIYHDAGSSERQIRNPSVIQRIDQEGFIWRYSCLLLSSIQELPLMYSGNKARSCHLYTQQRFRSNASKTQARPELWIPETPSSPCRYLT